MGNGSKGHSGADDPVPGAEPTGRRADGAQTLERGLLVLRALADAPQGLTASEVAARLGVHRSVAYRLLQALARTGFAARTGTRYRIGAELVALGQRVRPGLRQAAEPILADLADRTGSSACLLVRDGEHAVAITVTQPSTTTTHLSYRVGSRDALDRGAGSIAVQAAGPVSADDSDRVRAARREGFVLSSEEVTPGTHAVAAPIRTTHPDGPAAVTLITHRRETAEGAVDAVVAAAARIGAALG
ncbi:DNA-binding IclR family transcriptional regulator [Kineosphaera limosa]|uniref:Glycerol operon regulatory protein n=1 Tax=Kineosphaera limosa NBRC 100340 TaxID=1184609 RepID=K6VJE1_9MICO|nr:helix-turn-helix domain-containing protein [Kineosphaera limosa]NYD99164.1 DNA-binding IclR family transcriptional regulator [Kineosphaera limosa]GAB96328.1 putative IclR family transcriptional regulator [Kineosphaera limosa NBRC 100340]